MNEIARLQAVTGISDLTKFGQQEAAKILDDLSSGKITKADLSSLLGTVPNAADVVVRTLRTIDSAVAQADSSQLATLNAAIDKNNKSLEMLDKLIDGCTSNQTRESIAERISEINKSFNETVASMNNSNNSFWKTIAGVGLCVGIIGLIAVSTKRA